ncbi:MAG: sigma-70 family RNA polymerase sigma factor [Muribaculaceae bacterium]|jgi:RNA polymerase sigma-70 factor (ECF subfamily)|nr:sigma-70 family RNA polymerase sigma factor [Muribaculaceae bacterium]
MELNEAEFGRIIRENKGTIYTVCYMFSKDKDEVDDLFQEALIKLWQGFASFQGKSDLKTWIYKVTLNSCISIDRKKKSRKTQPLMEGINLFDQNDADNRQTDMLHARIQRLQPFDRAIVLLWLENMSYQEIAQIVGIEVKNVSVRLYRIKEQLKQMN